MADASPRMIIEYTRIGMALRVTAVDVATGTEATFQAPASTPRLDLERMAVAKLNYVLAKKKSP